MSTPTDSIEISNKAPVKTPSPFWLEFLGSMPLAITLLSTLAIASVIGTVLQQNQAYQDYLIKFGPFWFEVFKNLQLYDVYSASWFITILAFLVISTSICIYRNTPKMFKEMKNYRLDIQEKSLKNMKNNSEFTIKAPLTQTQPALEKFLQVNGYQSKSKILDQDQTILIAGRKGNGNRLGYIFTHSAIVIICLGGLLDSGLNLKLGALLGSLKIETRNIPASQVPEASWIETNNPAFRASINIPENSQANLAFINIKEGYVIQKLPFDIELKDFRIEHHITGQPKSFESDLIIHDPDLSQALEQTISVNHPLIYKGYHIYQASFNDGGSALSIKTWPFIPFTYQPIALINGPEPKDIQLLTTSEHQFNSHIFEKVLLRSPLYNLTIEFNDFRLFNIEDIPKVMSLFATNEAETELRNLGPSIIFKVRDQTGQAIEFINYMVPIKFAEGSFLVTGMREELNQPYQYFHIPTNKTGSPEAFFNFLYALYDPEIIEQVSAMVADEALIALNQTDNETIKQRMLESLPYLLNLFLQQGETGIFNYVQETFKEQVNNNAPGFDMDIMQNFYLELLQNMIVRIYQVYLFQQGNQEITEEDWQFLDNSLRSITILPTFYGSPFYLQLTNFQQRQASGLQITKSPGKNIVYFGSVLLILGVFMMFYISQNRLWFYLISSLEETKVIFAGSANRNLDEFNKSFVHLNSLLLAKLPIQSQDSRSN